MFICRIRNKRAGGEPPNWTGAPGSPERTPDFLLSLLALANFMRLSLMKAAHAGVGGAPCRKSGYLGRKDGAQPLHMLYFPLENQMTFDSPVYRE
jgi:hypothetical protein